MHDINKAHYSGVKEGFIQLLEHLLPQLPYKSLGEAIWAMRDMPLVDDVTAVSWILEYCQPSMVCHENINTQCPILGYNHQGHEAHRRGQEYSDIRPGEVIVLVQQGYPIENGVYVFTGDTNPLMRH